MPIFPNFEDQFINERNKPALFKKDFTFTVEETKKIVLKIITDAQIDPYNIRFLTFCNYYITKLRVDLSKEKFTVIRILVGMYNDKDVLDDFIRLNITLENHDIFRILYGYSIKIAERIDSFLDSRIKSKLNELLKDDLFIEKKYEMLSFSFAIPLWFSNECFCKTFIHHSFYTKRNVAGYDMCECKALFEEMIFYKDYIRNAETKGFLEFELNNASITMNIYRDIPKVSRLYFWRTYKPYTENTIYQMWGCTPHPANNI